MQLHPPMQLPTLMPTTRIPPSRRAFAVTVAVFVLSAAVAIAAVWGSESRRIAYERTQAEELAQQYSNAIELNVEQALSSTYALGTLVKLGKGSVQDFDITAATLLTFYPGASALELAPGGVVRQVVPLAGNERAVGHNLLVDPERDKEAFLARDSGKLTLAGPFKLIQGGMGAAGRLPVYLDGGSGTTSFWGFAIVLIRFPDILNTAHIAALAERGYRYEVWRTHPDTGKKHVIASSTNGALSDPVQLPLQVPNATWTLSIAPETGWIDAAGLAIKASFAALACAGLTGIARNQARRILGS